MTRPSGGERHSDVPVLDDDALAAIRAVQDAGAPGLLEEMAALFFGEGPKRLAGLEEALALRDGAALRRCSHTLKGSCLALGLTRLGHACEVLEQEGAGGRLDDAPMLVSRIVAEYEIGAMALRRAVSPDTTPN
jgi:HPt (histidine-containing phosphotransfer) domain-containing protein